MRNVAKGLKMQKKTKLKSLAILGLVALTAACNTVEGAGQDLKSAGKEIEKTADDAK